MATLSDALAVAVQHHQAGRLQAAEQIYRRVLAVDSSHVDALHLLGVIAFQMGRHELAIEYISRAIELNGTESGFHNNLGNVFLAQGHWVKAIGAYRRALELKPDHAEAHNNLGSAFQGQGKLNEAIACFRRAVELQSDYAAAHYNLGTALQAIGKLDEAVACLQCATALNPNHAEAHNNLGNTLKAQEKLDEAVDCFRRALRRKPDYAEAYNNLGNAFQAQGKVNRAVHCYRRATRLKPELAEAHYNLGTAFQSSGKLDEALACFRRALELKPDLPEAYTNLGSVLHDRGKLDEAVSSYLRALELRPDYPEARYNQSLLMLQRGNFEQGWLEHQRRWKCKEFRAGALTRAGWDGSPVDKAIVLHCDQGIGDTLQFVRYAPLVKQRAGEVLVRCARNLIPLLGRCHGIDRFITPDVEVPRCEAEAHLTSLPLVFRTTLETIPHEMPYLFADRALVEKWRDRLPAGAFRVGIAWQGSPDFRHDRSRSVPLLEFGVLTKVDGVRLISLQQGHGIDQLAGVKDYFEVTELSPDLDSSAGAFMDTAAVMMSLDLVITSDTSIAHLAGGLGVPVWVALSFNPEWRWLLDRSDSP